MSSLNVTNWPGNKLPEQNVVILYVTKLAHTRFSNSINLLIDVNN